MKNPLPVVINPTEVSDFTINTPLILQGANVKSDLDELKSATLNLKETTANLTSTTINGHPLTSNITLTPTDLSAVPTSRTVNNYPLSTNITLTATDLSAVPTSRTINSHPLSSNITLVAADVSAVPTSRTVNGYALSSNISLNATDISAVPTSRTVNGHALSSNVTITKSDVGLGNVDNTSDMNKPVSTAQAAAIAAVSTIPTTWSWVLGGSAYDYITDPMFYPTLEYNPSSYSVSGLLGDGIVVPRFWVNNASNVAYLRRTSTGLRLKHSYLASLVSGDYPWPNTAYSYGDSPTANGGTGCAIVIPTPLFGAYTQVQIDFSIQTNYNNVATISGTDYIDFEFSLCRTAGVTTTNIFRPEKLITHTCFRYGSAYSGHIGEYTTFFNNYRFTSDGARGQRDISMSPYTVAGITYMDYRIVIEGPIVRLYNCEHGGTLTERSSTTWPSWMIVPRVEALMFATGKSINDDSGAVRYIEIQNLSITATKI